jgi:two-component system response regulator YesN
MYRLLIVDDEEIITDALYDVFSRFMPDLLDVCKAYSGKEALSWMSRTRIDIVLTDIAMPGINGLDLMENIQTFWPRCKVIILTGHSSFDYVYQAIQKPSVRYLLKTEGYDKVTDSVNEVLQEIQRSNLQNLLMEQSREQMYAYEFMTQGDYMRHLLQESNVYCADRDVMLNEFSKLNITLDPTQHVLMVLGQLTYPEGKTYTERSEVLASARATWDHHLLEQTHSIGIVDKYGDILWFLQPSNQVKEKLDSHFQRFLEGTLELIQEGCLGTLGLTISFTISNTCCDWRVVTQTYERLRQLQQLKMGKGIPAILRECSDQIGEDSNTEDFVPSHKVDVMSAHLEAGRVAEFRQELEKLLDFMQFRKNVQRMIETYYSIAVMIYSYINRVGLLGRIDAPGKLLRLDDHCSLKEGFQYLDHLTGEILKFKQIDERDRATQVIDRICQHIENHLSEDLSLVRLAEIHYFNPSYLSFFFKQERGINLSNYIDKCRIRKAKELLRDPDMKIREVGEAVGYNAAHSFTRFFKKVTGMAPKEYRDTVSMS